MLMVSGPAEALASWTAARSEQSPRASAQVPSPGLASTESVVTSTVSVAADAGPVLTTRPVAASAAAAAIVRTRADMGAPEGGRQGSLSTHDATTRRVT